MLCIIRWRSDQCRGDKLIARLGYTGVSDRQPDANAGSNRTATASETKPTNTEANRWRRVIEHVRTTDHRESNRGMLATILTNQDRLRCRLKSADGDMDRILAGVINSGGAIRRRELRPSASRQNQKSQQDYCSCHYGRNACERRKPKSTTDDDVMPNSRTRCRAAVGGPFGVVWPVESVASVVHACRFGCDPFEERRGIKGFAYYLKV